MIVTRNPNPLCLSDSEILYLKMSLIYQDLSSIDIDIDIDIGDPTTMTKNMKLSLVKEFLQVEVSSEINICRSMLLITFLNF